MSKEIPVLGDETAVSYKVERISDIEEQAFSLLVPRHKELAIKLEDFEGTYGSEQIARDLQAVEKKKSRMEDVDSPSHRRAQLLEALLAEEIELADWFGENAQTIVPSEYDDLYNGVDLTAEFEKEGYFQYLGMSIDVTSGPGGVAKKLGEIKKRIEEGKLGEMKYLLSERNNIKGHFEGIPQFVVGADPRTIRNLADLWLTAQQTVIAKDHITKQEMEEIRQKSREAKMALANHRARALILMEIKDQLETFINFVHQRSPELEAKYKSLLAIVGSILSNISLSKQQEQENDIDDVYRALRKELVNF